jgi:hypothetical protein
MALSSRHELQLVFITALTLALKTRSGMNVELDFVSEKICCDLYEEEELIEMEMQMLMALGWRLNGPTPHDFIDYFMELLPAQKNIEMIKSSLSRNAKNYAELALMDFPHAMQLPSSIAFKSIVHSIRQGSIYQFDALSFLEHVSMIIDLSDVRVMTSKQIYPGQRKTMDGVRATGNVPSAISPLTRHIMDCKHRRAAVVVSPSA